MNNLKFLTAGIPLAAGKSGYSGGLAILKEMNLDGMEVEFVHGVRMSEQTAQFLKSAKDQNDFILTAHAPFYINLNSKEEEKVDASIKRIIETAQMATKFGGYSITYHAAFYMSKPKEEVFKQVYDKTTIIIETY